MDQTPREFLRSLDYTRKPSSPADVYTYVDCSRLLYSQLETINYLPYINAARFSSRLGFYEDVFHEYIHKDDYGRTIYHPQ